MYLKSWQRRSKRNRIKRAAKVKSMGLMLALIFLFSFAVALYVNHEAGSAAQGTRYFDEITVNPGDTLWTLAGPYRPEGMDIRHYVDIVAEINGVEDGIIQPGQLIALPRK